MCEKYKNSILCTLDCIDSSLLFVQLGFLIAGLIMIEDLPSWINSVIYGLGICTILLSITM